MKETPITQTALILILAIIVYAAALLPKTFADLIESQRILTEEITKSTELTQKIVINNQRFVHAFARNMITQCKLNKRTDCDEIFQDDIEVDREE